MSCPKFGKWLVDQMFTYRILCREVAKKLNCSMSAVDNYRVGACYPRMPRLILLCKLVAARRDLTWETVALEILTTAEKEKARPGR